METTQNNDRSKLLAAAVARHIPAPRFSGAENLHLFVKQALHRTLTQAPVFPLAAQIKAKGYNLKTFRSDLIGSVTIALIMLPQGIAYSSLTHLPIANCLITAVWPVLVYAIFGGSPQLSMGPEATISTIVGAVVTQQLDRNPDLSAVQVVTSLSFLIGALLIGLSMLQAGFLDHILSGYLLTGFVLGAACLIITEQLPSVLGLTIKTNQDQSTILQFIDVCKGLWTAHWQTVLLSASNIIFLLFLKSLKKKYGSKYSFFKFLPEYLVLAVVMIAISAGANLGQYGITVLGSFDNAIPSPTVPVLTIDMLSSMFESAITVLLVGYIECMTVTRNFGLRNGYVPSGNRELFSLGFTNLVGSFLGCYPVFASLPRSRILVNCGARTTLSNSMAGVLILIAFMSLKSVFQYIPKAMLSSIIVVSALGLIETKEIMFVFRTRAYTELFMLLATFGITLATSLSTGVLLCLGLSALLIVRKTTTSNISIIGRLPPQTQTPVPTPAILPQSSSQSNQLTSSPQIMDQGITPLFLAPTQQNAPHHHHHRHYVSVTEHPDAMLLDGVLILRVDVPLMFYNCAQVRRSLEVVMGIEKKLLIARKKRNRVAETAAANGNNAGPSGAVVFSVEDDGKGWLVAGGEAGVDDHTDDATEAGMDVEDDDDDVDDVLDCSSSDKKSSWLSKVLHRPSKSSTTAQQGTANAKADSTVLNVLAPLASTQIDRIARSRLRTSSIGIGMFGSSGDVPIDPSALTHAAVQPLSGDSAVNSLKHDHDSDALIRKRRQRRRKDGSIHSIILDFGHCPEIDTAAAQVLQEILSTFLYDGVEIFLSRLHANQVVLLERADVHKLIMKYCLFFDELEAAVNVAEEKRK
ncbi:UNVERIFIED_CONTAM: Solute carrier 26 [Siphonaria sp. JEL0065]|nr:Solute carrier 26 [Siphonaria sp. JEL0065]